MPAPARGSRNLPLAVATAAPAIGYTAAVTDDREERHAARQSGGRRRDARRVVSRGVVMLLALLALAITLAIVFDNRHVARVVLEIGRWIGKLL